MIVYIYIERYVHIICTHIPYVIGAVYPTGPSLFSPMSLPRYAGSNGSSAIEDRFAVGS